MRDKLSELYRIYPVRRPFAEYILSEDHSVFSCWQQEAHETSR
nr:MAG TPA: hypothetical protein [Caudoviricetes sp.]